MQSDIRVDRKILIKRKSEIQTPCKVYNMMFFINSRKQISFHWWTMFFINCRKQISFYQWTLNTFFRVTFQLFVLIKIIFFSNWNVFSFNFTFNGVRILLSTQIKTKVKLHINFQINQSVCTPLITKIH
jgi:hypothetical protein